MRIAFFLSHPTQFEVPFFRYLAHVAQDLHLKAFYWNTSSADRIQDPELGHAPGWDMPLTGGYDSEVLPQEPELFHEYVRKHADTGLYDAWIVNGYSAWQARMAIDEAQKTGIPVLLRSDTTDLYPRPFFKEAVKSFLLSRKFKRIAAFLVTGSQSRKYIMKYGVASERVFEFPYAVDNEGIAKSCKTFASTRDEIRAVLGIPAEATVVLAVVKFVRREGGLDLIRSFETVADKHPMLHLVMVGDGADRDEFHDYVGSRKIPRVVFPGYQPYSQLPKFYAIADVFAHPAHFEPWGVSVNEAMACGLPVVLSDLVGASYDLVRDSENGYVYHAGDIPALRAALEKFLSRRSDWPAMGARSADIIRGFDYASCVATLRLALESSTARAPVTRQVV